MPEYMYDDTNDQNPPRPLDDHDLALRKGFTLVVTFDGSEDNECLEQVQQTIAYLRDRGWTVEENGG